MAKNNRRVQHNNRPRSANPAFADTRTLRRAPEPIERRAPTVYGKAFIILEDAAKNTFIFKEGAWVPHSESIAECRLTCQVKELPQRLNRMIRYEVRSQAN